ncbi:MAG: asparaginase [Proteobacteria bacterium]|nr:asparaginase [Pseudomonadota bacterium]
MEAKVFVTRGGYPECIHRFHIVIVDKEGKKVFERGDKNFLTCLRSSAKPFQALTALRAGIVEKYGLTDEEIAILTGSINAEPFQVETVRSILTKGGLDEGYLQCGAQYPSHKLTAEKLKKENKPALAIYHNCSAKHSGMLLACKAKGYPLENYLDFEHPYQMEILNTVSEFTQLAIEDIKIVIDGCGAPVFFMPLINLAIGYKNLAISKDPYVLKLISSVYNHPLMIAGNERLCSDIIKITEGRIFAKIGADGVYSAFNRDTKEGLAMKVEDGAVRPLYVMFTQLLKELGWITESEHQSLSKYWKVVVKNSKNFIVGEYLAKI